MGNKKVRAIGATLSKTFPAAAVVLGEKWNQYNAIKDSVTRPSTSI